MAKATKISDRELDNVRGGTMNFTNATNTDTFDAYDGTLTAEPINGTLATDTTLTKI